MWPDSRGSSGRPLAAPAGCPCLVPAASRSSSSASSLCVITACMWPACPALDCPPDAWWAVTRHGGQDRVTEPQEWLMPMD